MPWVIHGSFVVENMILGPNPRLSHQDLVINYTLNGYDHSLDYHLYSITGEALAKKSFSSTTTPATRAGDNKFVLQSASELHAMPKQLTIAILVFKSGSNTIKKRAYVVFK